MRWVHRILSEMNQNFLDEAGVAPARGEVERGHPVDVSGGHEVEHARPVVFLTPLLRPRSAAGGHVVWPPLSLLSLPRLPLMSTERGVSGD